MFKTTAMIFNALFKERSLLQHNVLKRLVKYNKIRHMFHSLKFIPK